MSYPADGNALYEDAACGLLVTQADGSIVRANRTICAWLGRSQLELMGCRLQSLLTIGGRIFHQTHWAPLLKLQGSLAEVKLELRHANGHKIPMVMNAVVRVHDGSEFHELAIFSARDRHRYEDELLKSRERAEAALRQAQQSQRELAEAQVRLELAVSAARLFQWSIGLPGRHRRYSPEVAILLGYTDARAIEADEFLERIHPEDREAEQAAQEAVLNSASGRFQTVFRLNGVDGAQRWIAGWGQVRHDPSGEPMDLVGVMQDVTEAHAQRALAEDRVLLAEQTLGIVGHDLRNPLSAIHMSAEVLRMRHLDADAQREVASRIQNSTRRATRLIGDLLDFTQTRAGRGLSLNISVQDGHVIAREVVAEMSAAYPKRDVRHVVRGDGVVHADGDRISQALGNLVSNAMTYGFAGSVVTVTSEGRGGLVRWTVHNHGPAIDPKLRPAIFEPMTRGEACGQLRSVGLGLYIVREIAIAHGGRVDFVSEEGEGTSFFITLPSSADAQRCPKQRMVSPWQY